MKRCRLDPVAKVGGKADSPKHSEMILGKSFFGIANRANYTVLNIPPAIDIIDDITFAGIHEEGINGKVTAAHVTLSIGKFNMSRPASVFVAALGAKSCDFMTMSLLNL
jgi:TM2 domain-containing membrane protein YozV